MPQLVILADDFTGALDTAAKLASRHIPCYVTSRREINASDLPSDYEVLTIDTETRHILPEKAYSIYRDLSRSGQKIPAISTLKPILCCVGISPRLWQGQ